MESAQAEVVPIPHSPDFKTRYVIYTKVENVSERFETLYEIDPNNPQGPILKSQGKSLGHYVNFEGSWEALHLGMDKPTLAKGDKVRITVEKVI